MFLIFLYEKKTEALFAWKKWWIFVYLVSSEEEEEEEDDDDEEDNVLPSPNPLVEDLTLCVSILNKKIINKYNLYWQLMCILCLSVCLFVSSKRWMAEPIIPKFNVGPCMSPGKVFDDKYICMMYIK